MMINDRISRLVPVSESSQVSEARRAVRDLAAKCEFSDEDAERACIVATEAATNLVKHTSQGGCIVADACNGVERSLQILSIDKGPGFDLARCMADGFSTTNSHGTGLGAIRRQSDDFDAYSQASGSVIVAVICSRQQSPLHHSFHIASVSAPSPGEDVCGDGWDCWQKDERLVLMVADGLGHGLLAHEAAEEARRVFGLRKPPAATELLGDIHKALQKTRGGAVAIADIHLDRSTLTFGGLGNIAGVISADQQHRSLVSMNGTAGAGIPRLKAFDYPWRQDNVLIMHTDGLHGHWSLDAYPGLHSRHPAVIAGVLFRDGVRGRDDATVVVVKTR